MKKKYFDFEIKFRVTGDRIQEYTTLSTTKGKAISEFRKSYPNGVEIISCEMAEYHRTDESTEMVCINHVKRFSFLEVNEDAKTILIWPEDERLLKMATTIFINGLCQKYGWTIDHKQETRQSLTH